jgi:hypothetical protein
MARDQLNQQPGALFLRFLPSNSLEEDGEIDRTQSWFFLPKADPRPKCTVFNAPSSPRSSSLRVHLPHTLICAQRRRGKNDIVLSQNNGQSQAWSSLPVQKGFTNVLETFGFIKTIIPLTCKTLSAKSNA